MGYFSNTVLRTKPVPSPSAVDPSVLACSTHLFTLERLDHLLLHMRGRPPGQASWVLAGRVYLYSTVQHSTVQYSTEYITQVHLPHVVAADVVLPDFVCRYLHRHGTATVGSLLTTVHPHLSCHSRCSRWGESSTCHETLVTLVETEIPASISLPAQVLRTRVQINHT
jgi:hypothetical protein